MTIGLVDVYPYYRDPSSKPKFEPNLLFDRDRFMCALRAFGNPSFVLSVGVNAKLICDLMGLDHLHFNHPSYVNHCTETTRPDQYLSLNTDCISH